MTFSHDELLRYARHFTLNEVGIKGQEQLKKAKVLCIGAGGLGCPALLYLTSAGIGTVGIVDHDQVELTNLHRQIIYNHHDLGLSKAVVAANKLRALNPHSNIFPYETRLDSTNAFDLFAAYDIVVDCSDNFATRYLVNDTCFYLQKPNVFASISLFAGQCSVFCLSEQPCYRCLYDEPPPADLILNCADGGVLGVLPGLLGAIQATEVLKLILGIGQTLVGRLLIIDALTMRFNELSLKKNSDCRLCNPQQTFPHPLPYYEAACKGSIGTNRNIEPITASELLKLQDNKHVFILDVREPYEHAICRISDQLIPLSQLTEQCHTLDATKTIVVYCKSGIRGEKAGLLLKNAGFPHVRNLTGGILAWINEIDPSLPRY